MSNRADDKSLAEGALWEQAVSEIVVPAVWPGCKASHFPACSHIDFGVIADSGLFTATLEVKQRGCTSTAFESTMVLKEKHQAARFFRRYFNAPSWCVVVFEDRLGLFRLDHLPDGEERHSRGDREDSEKLYATYRIGREGWVWHDELLEPIKQRVEELRRAQ